MRPMTDEQRDFWRELLAPFEPHETEETRGFTYVKKPAAENRLDDVVGPDGWYTEYRETEAGQTCRLYILCPGSDGQWHWHYKEDGGGEELMEKKKDVPDPDNSAKSGYTNAFRRAVSAWGMSRNLYRQGVPKFLRDLYVNDPSFKQSKQSRVKQPTQAPPPASKPAPAPAAEAKADPAPAQAGDKDGRALLQWARQVKDKLSIDLTGKLKAIAETEGLPADVAAWNVEQVAAHMPAIKQAVEDIKAMRRRQAAREAQAPAAPGEHLPVNAEGTSPFESAPAEPAPSAGDLPPPFAANAGNFSKVGEIRVRVARLAGLIWSVPLKRGKPDKVALGDAYQKTLAVARQLLPEEYRAFRVVELIDDPAHLDALLAVLDHMDAEVAKNPGVFDSIQKEVA